jgi:hypothetical protein
MDGYRFLFMLEKIKRIIQDNLEECYFDVESLGGCKNMITLEVSHREYHQAGNSTVYDIEKYTIEIRKEKSDGK